MVPHRREPQVEAPGDSQAGLENHLRNLIISNGPPLHDSVPRASLQSAPLSQSNSDNRGDSVETSDGAPHQSKPARKRLNQAQRRQMSSQLSISIDPRAQQPPPDRAYQSPTSQYSRPSQPYQRHMHTDTQPWGAPSENRQSGSFSHRHWNGPQQPRYRGYDNTPPSSRGRPNSMPIQSNRSSGYLYNTRRAVQFHPEEIAAQDALLDQLCFQVVSNSEIERSEIAEKEEFRCRIETISREVIANYEKEERPETDFQPLTVQLKCFGSLSSGFATKASDMDLGLLSPMSASQPDAPGSPIPRLLEKAFLEAGLGARLLTRTRVPIIKLCQSPPENLRQGLLEERFRWENGLDEAPEGQEDDEHDPQAANNEHESQQDPLAGIQNSPTTVVEPVSQDSIQVGTKTIELKQGPRSSLSSYYGLAKRVLRRAGGRDATISNCRVLSDEDWILLNRVSEAFISGLADTRLRDRLSTYPSLSFVQNADTPTKRSLLGVYTQVEGEHIRQRWEESGVEERNPASQSLTGQALKDVMDYITLLRSPLQQNDRLRLGDGFFIPLTPTTVDLVARIRQLPDPHKMAPNQPRDRYRDHLEFPKTGAVNVAEPFVSPNLQQLAPPPPPGLSPVEFEDMVMCRGHNVQFWRNEEEILNLARANQLNGNKDTIGHLLRGFFEYYAHSSMLSTSMGRGFDWGRDVLSLRTPGGLQTKQDKGWTGAKTVIEAQNVGPHPPPQSDQATSTTVHPKESDVKDTGAQPKQGTQGSVTGKNGEFKEVRHRYLFAIEDPFELDHNVARTVTHNGIVSIRDEFRRAWKIIKSAGNGSPQESLLRDVADVEEEGSPLSRLLDEIHGAGRSRNT
ncbi:Poly(A) RNA polymerase protein cid1 [Fusarium odoratissimum]|uniref:polynucleotide adenylyltransferase n=1 Tax=Fusarium oxysporum f. sp. cubense (strain race 4) TaxID=2502994 RepID=N1RPR4_FUSC4|nr:Poly(A) RNA polymerase protein cid1 [Fusarium odoratissimum]